ncbi:non-heme iron oxygenase ferredoxin subunit [Sphingomonas daechungensis]|uniref:Rieske 2Fe-2S domain-containing protein n=1 Tax=Sphingomonas daechungensis TaxID=1176646 RepID=A0ABX6SYJ9_9SPHN|nr:Rieske 2Fe-2S domain-containing protein [Sphingomonas daechungensis]QNP42535.1 Rieske 2Fe-2S domain-containing protein [Sphingomonas daechungensis]
MAFERVASLSEIPESGSKAFDVRGTPVLIARAPMGIYAVGAICSHQYTPLEGGKLKACFIFCPLHGVRFDLRDGKPAGTLTDQPIPTWPVMLQDEDVLVDLG